MSRTIVLFLVLIMAAATTLSARAAVKVERIEYKHGGAVFEGILAFDDAVTDKRPGILVCQEWWGINEYMESRARQLAELGYVAFALDMYGKGKATTDPNQAGQWSKGVFADYPAMRERAAAGLKVLAERPEVDASRLAAIGYCMGGTVALELARSGLKHTENLRAIVAFHSSTIAAKTPTDNANIKGSVLICHGQADTFVKPDEIPIFHKQMAEAKIDYQFVAYAGAVHAFTNPGADKFGIEGVKYDAKADRRSWALMQNLFREVFGGAPATSKKP